MPELREMKVLYLKWAALILLGILLCSCGKKAPPEPPGRTALPVVENLQIDREGGRVTLQWTLPSIDADALKDLAGFYVYRAGSPMALADCRTCPLEYAPVGDVAFGSGRVLPRTWSFIDIPPAGYFYTYRVRCYSRYDEEGPASRTVSVIVPGENTNGGEK